MQTFTLNNDTYVTFSTELPVFKFSQGALIYTLWKIKTVSENNVLYVEIHRTNHWADDKVMGFLCKRLNETVFQNRYDQVIVTQRCSEPGHKVEAIYNRLHYKSKPFVKRKSVVHKTEFEKLDVIDLKRLLI